MIRQDDERTSGSITKSRIIPSRRKTSTLPNLLYPGAPEARPHPQPAEQPEVPPERQPQSSGEALLPYAKLPLSVAGPTDQSTLPTSKSFSGLIRRRPRHSRGGNS